MTRLILLAAGLSRRFGGDKLSAQFRGRPLWRWSFDAAAQTGRQVIVVTHPGPREGWAAEYGFQAVLVPPGLEQSASVAAGTAAAEPEEDLCFFVCDQPHFPGHALRGFLDAFEGSGKPLARAWDGARYGSPTAFSAALRRELLSLRGDRGARALFAGREGETLLYPVPPGYLTDYDTPWEGAEGRKAKKGD